MTHERQFYIDGAWVDPIEPRVPVIEIRPGGPLVEREIATVRFGLVPWGENTHSALID